MEKVKKYVSLILIYSYLLSICSCTQMVVKERDVTVKVPYQEAKEVQKFKTIPPVFPLPKDRPMLLAVLPFTSSTGHEADGIEVAEEIEYALQKHPEASRKYRILNRTQLNAVFTEKELAGLDLKTIKQTKQFLNVEGLITGHIKHKTVGTLSFILKAIDTEEAGVLFTERFEGKYDQSIKDVVSVFYDQKVPNGWITTYETRYKDEVKTEKYQVEETYTPLIIYGIIAVATTIYVILF